MVYLANFETCSKIEDIGLKVEKASCLLESLIVDKMGNINNDTFEYYKDSVMIYADIVWDYICDAKAELKKLTDKCVMIDEKGEIKA